MSEHPLEPIFHPRGVALIGVPSGTQSMSGGFLTALLETHFEDRHGLYPVNPKMDEVQGIRCYPTLLDTPDPVDHVISLVPARVVPDIVDQVIQKRARSIHFFTAGFSETGDERMAALEREMVGRLVAAGVRVIGPNCMGLYVPSEGLAFMGGFPQEPGNVMLVSQSGANAGDVIHGLGRRGVRFSKAISFGNGADLRAHDFFDYARSDETTEVVTAYLEGIQDGRKMFASLRALAAEKPTILLKGGLTGAGARAAHSHTGSLAGSTQIFDATCRQTGAMHAETMDDLQDLAVAVTTSLRRVRGRGIALVGGGGGFAVLSADAIAAAGLEVPPMPQATKDALHEFIPVAGTSVNNPIDTNAGANAFDRTMKTVAASGVIDVMMVNPNLGRGPFPPGPAERDEPEAERLRSLEQAKQSAVQLARLQDETGVPFIALLRSRGAAPELFDVFEQEAYRLGVATFTSVARAARTIAHVLDWRASREGLPELL